MRLSTAVVAAAHSNGAPLDVNVCLNMELAQLKTVITYGTFDLFHVGHVRLLKRLRKLGDRLVVGLSTDEFSIAKGKSTIIPYEQRKEILCAVSYVDKVFPEVSWDQKVDDIQREHANIFAMGDDWAGKFDFLAEFLEVVYIPRTPDISTTELKQVMDARYSERIQAIRHALDHVDILVNELARSPVR